MTFGEKLRHARLMQGLTQTALAEKTGLSNVTMSHYENGRREPSSANLRRLAKGLNITSDYLLCLPYSPKTIAHTLAARKTE